METVTVAKLKARLSHYLREALEEMSFTVVSHGIPVAVLGPCDVGGYDDLEVMEPDPDASPLSLPVLGRPASAIQDAADLIRRDRDGRDT